MRAANSACWERGSLANAEVQRGEGRVKVILSKHRIPGSAGVPPAVRRSVSSGRDARGPRSDKRACRAGAGRRACRSHQCSILAVARRQAAAVNDVALSVSSGKNVQRKSPCAHTRRATCRLRLRYKICNGHVSGGPISNAITGRGICRGRERAPRSSDRRSIVSTSRSRSPDAPSGRDQLRLSFPLPRCARRPRLPSRYGSP